MAQKVQPMSAARGLDESTAYRLRYPLFESIKLDGIRMIVHRDADRRPIVLSKSFKPIRSAFVQKHFAKEEYVGFDGEAIVGDPTDGRVCNKTYSAVMTMGSMEPVDFYVFDHFTYETVSFENRYDYNDRAIEAAKDPFVRLVPQRPVHSWDEILEREHTALDLGYEGLILRDPKGIYKFGRSTLIEQYLVKLKRVKTGEAYIMGYVELMLNQNEPVKDALGYQKRSSSKEGKIPGGTLGALIVRDYVTGVEFEIGSGFDDALRAEIWGKREEYLGRLLTYSYFPIGQINKPRQPIFKNWRDPDDMITR